MKYLILGASAAGINAAKTLRSLDKDANIIIASKDGETYSRCMLHYYLSDERDMKSLDFVEDNFFDEYNIEWKKEMTAKNINTEDQTVEFQDGSSLSYDKLLIATGSSATIPPIKNIENSNNVFVLRDIEDANSIKDKLSLIDSAIIVGGGLVGIDIATELINLDIDLTIVEFTDNILSMQLDEKSSSIYHDKIINSGVDIYTGCSADEVVIDDNNNFKGLKLSNGEEIMADIVIIAAGVKPNIDFLKDTDINLDNGIVVDNKCATNLDNIYAAGDVCSGKPGIWPLAVKQSIVAANNMTNNSKEIDSLFGYKNTMNFFGINTISLGNPNLDKEDDYNIDIYKTDDTYKKIIHKDGVIYSAIFQGDIDYVGTYEKLIKDEIDISQINKDLFELGYGDFFSIDENAEFQFQ